jgi:hypothetical protein
MKRFVSVVVLALFMLNIMGYYGVFVGMRYKNTRDFTVRLHAEDYTEGEMLTVKIPITIPYLQELPSATENFVAIEHQGEFYTLVKQRLVNDTLEMVCVRNHERKQIEDALTDYVKTFTENTSDGGPQSQVIPTFIKDFLSTHITLEASGTGWVRTIQHAASATSVLSENSELNSPPPRG